MARRLVSARLAACVSVTPRIRAFYRWQDQIEETVESQLIIKTTAEKYAALAAYLRQHHPYQLPEILAIDVANGLPDYLGWVMDETRPLQETAS